MKTLFARYWWPLALLLLGRPAPAQTLTPPADAGTRFVRDSLRAYVERGRRLWNIPGVAVAVVKDGQVITSEGFGTRAAGGQGGPVDGNTLFLIASNSKLFTGTALAQLAQEGRLKLNDPVRRYLPGFRLADSAASRLVSVRDLLGHKLGLKTFQGDFIYWNSDYTPAEALAALGRLQPVYPFRQNYGYCNLGFVAAGEVLRKVSGQSWADWVQARLLTPLGMARTFTGTDGVAQRPNVAVPYSTTYGPLARLPYDALSTYDAAGGLVSCTNDLTHWLRFQLDSGRYQGQRVLPWAALAATRGPNTLLGTARSPLLPSHFTTYGLGAFSADYNGRQIYWHTGGADGFVTNVCFVPEVGLGLVVLTNQDNQDFYEALRYQLLDAYLGVPYVDRSRQLWQLSAAERNKVPQEVAALAVRAAKRSKPPRPLAAYAGTYQNTLFGSLTVAPRGRQLLVSFAHHPNLTATLDYLDGDTFRLTYSNPAYGVFAAPFTWKDGQVSALEVRVNDFLDPDPYLFTRP